MCNHRWLRATKTADWTNDNHILFRGISNGISFVWQFESRLKTRTAQALQVGRHEKPSDVKSSDHHKTQEKVTGELNTTSHAQQRPRKCSRHIHTLYTAAIVHLHLPENSVTWSHHSYMVSSLVPRPFELGRRKGLVHIVHACASFSMAASHVSIVTCPRSPTYVQLPMDGKRTNIDDIQIPQFFSGVPWCMHT